MNKYTKVAFVLPVVIAAVPIVASAEEIKWNEIEDTYHLYDDVRTITFSHAVEPTSLQQIVVYDTTDQKEVATIAEIGEQDNQVKLKLAEGLEYENNHAYTLTVKGVKQRDTNEVVTPTKYYFKMIYKTPEEVSFANSYLVTNTSNETKSFKVPSGASYITYNEYGTSDSGHRSNVQVKQEQYVVLGKNDRMTVSFTDATNLHIQDGFDVTKTNDASHTIYKLYERNNIKITGQDRQSWSYVYFGNNTENVYGSYATYDSNLEVDKFKHRVETKKMFSNSLLYKLGNMIVTNEDDGFLYVYTPKSTFGFTKVEPVEEKAVVALSIEENEKLVATSTEPAYFTSLNYSTLQGKWNNSFVTYGKDDVHNTQYYSNNTASVEVGYDTIIKNEDSQPLTVSGPARYVSLEKTEEEPLTFYDLNNGDKVKVTSSFKETHPIYLRELSKKGTFSSINYYLDKVSTANYQKEVYTYGDDSFTVSEQYSNIIENTGMPSFLLYGAKRSVTFTPYNEDLFTVLELAPKGKVQVEVLKDTVLHLKDLTQKGQYTFTTDTGTQNRDFSYVTQPHSISKDGNVVIENLGITPITIFGVKNDISYNK